MQIGGATDHDLQLGTSCKECTVAGEVEFLRVGQACIKRDSIPAAQKWLNSPALAVDASIT